MPERRPAGDPEPVFMPVLTMAVAQFFDFGTFIVMVRRHGPGAEANPLVADLLQGLGIPGIVVAKIALVILVAATALVLSAGPGSSGQRRVAATVLGVGIVAGLVGGCTNALTLGAL
jgi:hypothetical protein